MTMSLPPNFEKNSNKLPEAVYALEKKIVGLRSVITYLEEKNANPEEIAMYKDELDNLVAQHHDLVHGDDDAIVSNPDDEGDAVQSGSSTADLERKVAEMQSRMDKQSQTKPLSKVAKAGMGLAAAALTGGTGLYLAAPKNTPVTPAPLETQSTAPNPEQRQAPTVDGVENSAEQSNFPVNISHTSPEGKSILNIGNVAMATGEQKKVYEKMLEGKDCFIEPLSIIDGQPAFRIVARGGASIMLINKFENNADTNIALNNTENLLTNNIYVYTLYEIPLATKPLVFSNGTDTAPYIINNTTITIYTNRNGSQVPWGSILYRNSDTVAAMNPSGYVQHNVTSPQAPSAPAQQTPAQPQPSSSPKGPFEHYGFGMEDFTGPMYNR
jgi:hypothetical protein